MLTIRKIGICRSASLHEALLQHCDASQTSHDRALRSQISFAFDPLMLKAARSSSHYLNKWRMPTTSELERENTCECETATTPVFLIARSNMAFSFA